MPIGVAGVGTTGCSMRVRRSGSRYQKRVAFSFEGPVRSKVFPADRSEPAVRRLPTFTCQPRPGVCRDNAGGRMELDRNFPSLDHRRKGITEAPCLASDRVATKTCTLLRDSSVLLLDQHHFSIWIPVLALKADFKAS